MNHQAKSAIEVRRATIADAVSIASILRVAFDEYRQQYTLEAFAATIPDGKKIRERFEEGPIWVAIENGEIVGTVSGVPKDDGLYIRSMAVKPSKSRRGIGRSLLDQVEKFALEKGFNQLFLSTTPFLGRAIELYTRFGFLRSDLGPHDLCGTPLFAMTKALRPSPEPESYARTSGR